MIDVRARLTAADLPEQLARLGFRGPDVPDALAAIAAAAQSDTDVARVDALARQLLARIGNFAFAGVENPLEEDEADAEHFGVGVLPLLALVATSPEVNAFHRDRGVPDDISWRSLGDLGQQAWVHRQTYGEFGLHTYEWMRIAWSGALFWLGRLQFNLQKTDAEWVLSTHIPATGALTPASVDDAFRQARDFFATHFADYPSGDFYCSSWLLDPELSKALPAESNMARFQSRWRLYGEPMRGDDDVLFFTFFRRGDVDLETLPQDTSLQRAIVGRLQSGQHWSVWQGRIPQSSIPSATAHAATGGAL
ncbi:MAG: acyltransferase domain-containing protein [Propionibacteriaceae bacterium]